MNDESVIDASSYSSEKSNLINDLIKNGFKYDSEIGYYYLKEDNIEYSYFPKDNIIKTKSNNPNKVFITIYLDKSILYYYNYDTHENYSIEIIDQQNSKYIIYKNYYNQYLSKYFKDFLEV